MTENDKVSVDKLTGAFIKIRKARAVLSAEFKEKDAKLVAQQDKIRQGLLDYCTEQNVESARTPEGSFFERLRLNFGQAIGNPCMNLSWSTKSLSFSISVLIRLM